MPLSKHTTYNRARSLSGDGEPERPRYSGDMREADRQTDKWREQGREEKKRGKRGARGKRTGTFKRCTFT